MTIEIPKKESLNIVPFIDIMLVLLAMVLSVSTFIAKGEIPIKLPEAKMAETPSQGSNSSVLIQVTSQGEIYWQGEELMQSEVPTRLATISRETKLVLRIDRDANFEHFIRLLDQIKGVQHENFVIATEKT